MPIIGYIDPSNEEKKADRPGRLPKWLPLDVILERALTGDPDLGPWPYELIQAMADNHEERDYISVTMLTGGCARGKVIERRANYIASIDQSYPSLRGTLIHRTLEYASRPNAVAEWRFYTELAVPGYGDVELSCSPDVVLYEGETGIWDWKTTENPPRNYYPYSNHVEQVQFNRWLVNHAKTWVNAEGEVQSLPFNPWEVKFQHLVLVYLGPKGPLVLEAKESIQVPAKTTGGTKSKRVPSVWSDDRVLDTMMPRLENMVLALDAYPQWPDDLDDAIGFEGPPGWGCPGQPWCYLPNCLAKRYPYGLEWPR